MKNYAHITLVEPNFSFLSNSKKYDRTVNLFMIMNKTKFNLVHNSDGSVVRFQKTAIEVLLAVFATAFAAANEGKVIL